MSTERNAKEKVNWLRVWIFVLLAFVIAWGGFGLGIIGHGFDTSSPNVWTVVTAVAVTFGPAIAAFLMRQFIGREGYADAGLTFRTQPLCYVWALILPILWGTAAILLKIVIGWAQVDSVAIPAVLVRFVVGLVLNGLIIFGEEFGWRSYLLEKLRLLGRWKALLLSSFIWGLWHIPFILRPNIFYSDPLGPPASAIPAQMIFTILLGFAVGWIYLTSASVIPAILMHAASNTWSGVLDSYLSSADITYAQTTWLWIAPLLVVLAGLYLTKQLRD